MGNGPDGLIVSQAWDRAAIHDLEDASFMFDGSIGSLIEKATHVPIPFGELGPEFTPALSSSPGHAPLLAGVARHRLVQNAPITPTNQVAAGLLSRSRGGFSTECNRIETTVTVVGRGF